MRLANFLFFEFVLCDKKLKYKEKPNIVLILADDYGYNDIGYHGSEIKTPHLDYLATVEGIRLENYYVQPICTPSRSQLMSGRYQIHTGLQHQLIWRGMPSGLPADVPLLPETLQQCGYSTMAVGKWHLGYAKSAQTPWGRGFDRFTGYLGGSEDYYKKTACQSLGAKHECGIDFTTDDSGGKRHYVNETEYSAFVYTKKTIEYINDHRRNDNEKPFFVYLPFQSVHMPLEAPDDYIKPYRKAGVDKKRAIYSGMVAVLDEAVGNITTYLKESGQWENTLIIFSTDNGGQAYAGGSNLPFRGNKGGYWEGGIKGNGFVSGGLIARSTIRGGEYNSLFHISDWMPTIIDATGCKSHLPPHLDGYNHWDNLHGPINDDIYHPRDELLHNIDPLSTTDGTESRHFISQFDLTKQAGIRWRQFKLLTGDPGYPDYPIPMPPNETHYYYDDMSSLELTRIPVRPTKLTRLVRLYDLDVDPLEENDISDLLPSLVEQLLSRLAVYNQTQTPVNFPPVDPLSFPSFQGGFYKPWFG